MSTTIKVRGYHLDVYQHVNNARYLEFLEEARWALFEDGQLLRIFAEKNLGFAVVNINISFRRAAVMGDVLDIRTEFAGFGEKSSVLKQTIFIAGTEKVVAEADVTYVILDLNTNRAIVLDDDLRTLLSSAS
ncbi:MAG: thioesterase family protein [Neisseria sp.]|nr:thioesterase family protein [Neisseria sp.]